VGLAALAAVALPALPALAAKAPKGPPPRYLFATVPWLVPADTAQARLVARGYRPVPEGRDSLQIVLRGRMYEHDVLVTGHLDEQGRLVRWVVMILARGEPYRWPDMSAIYDEVVEESEARYGTPRSLAERYRFPYERGDTREDEALRDGKLTIRRTWESKSGDRLTVEMDEKVSVVLLYWCREWEELEKRRRSKRASDL
jgi:hypothetical protein